MTTVLSQPLCHPPAHLPNWDVTFTDDVNHNVATLTSHIISAQVGMSLTGHTELIHETSHGSVTGAGKLLKPSTRCGLA